MCEELVRRSNCSAPIPPPGQPRGQWKNARDKKGRAQENEVKKGATPENEGIKVIK